MSSLISAHNEAGAPVRWGVWLLPVGGIIPAIVFTLVMLVPGSSGPEGDISAAAQQLADPFGLAFGGIFVAASLSLIFGFQALYAWLASGRARGWALAGAVLSTCSLGLTIMGWGAFTLAGKIVGDLYISGHTGVGDAIAPLSGGTFGPPIMAALIGAIILAALGAIATGAALWRSRSAPKWVAIVLPLGFVLFSGSAPIVTPLV